MDYSDTPFLAPGWALEELATEFRFHLKQLKPTSSLLPILFQKTLSSYASFFCLWSHNCN